MQTGYSPGGWTLLFKILFWIFNCTLLLIVYLGFMPFLGIGFLADLITGNVPLNFLLPFVGLVGVPTACSVVGVMKKQRQSVRTSSFSLVHLFFGVEMPLLLFSLIRFFMLRDLTPASGLLLLIGVFGTITYVHWFISGSDSDVSSALNNSLNNSLNSNNPLADGLHLTGLTLALGLAIYGLTISAFFFPAFITVMVVLPYLIVIVLPVGVVVLGFLIAPIGITAAYYSAWGQVMQHLGQRYGKTKVRGFAAGILAVGLAAVLLLQQQPQVKAFELLQTPPKTPQAQQALVKQSGVIRQGLLNAYLSQYRYPHDQNNQVVQYLYPGSFYSSSNVGIKLQALYNVVTTPFIYQGSALDDQQKASELYAQFFDQPIQRAELPAIEKALNSTFDRTAAKAGLNDINAQRVWLEEQRVTVTPQGDWADVEVYEVYDNRTNLDEEVLYYFSLPESAAITGLWLGESPDLASRYRFVVSPRGAAQKVYTDQVH
ncbi:MAG: TIGR02921 family PEP-CTERM protein, partial [Microcoleaceae cyanobacterium]